MLSSLTAPVPSIISRQDFSSATVRNVDFDHFGADLDGVANGGDRVFRKLRPPGFHTAAAMGDDHHMVPPVIGVLESVANFTDMPGFGQGNSRQKRRQ